MPVHYLTVGIVVERRKASSPWVEHIWTPLAVLPDVPDAPPWTSLGGDETRERFYLGPAEVALHGVDTGYFRDNFIDGAPKLWVAVRPTGAEPPLVLVGVTADPTEGESFTQTAEDIVEALPMPQDIAERVAAFFAAHHVERPFVKRKRDKTKGSAQGPDGWRP